MPHFNECSQLIEGADKAQNEYWDILGDEKDPLQVMLDMQKSLQVRLAKDKPEYNRHPDDLATAGEVVDWLRNQKDYIDDEFRELLTSLGGMSNGEKDASAVWKPWKSQHGERRETLITDLSPQDQLEIKFEMIDILHFVLNMFQGLGLTAEEIFKLYYLKNKHNFERQDNGY
ncbi:dCTP pyrophosphatase [Shigella flexneri]|uniref:dCTP pyrophosphatase, phage-associated n=1 Tax=Yersinia phage fPS-2 TaxID=2052930 RepID=A0A449C5W4_9CAUD|nr:nucleoside triphosphate pyrophosphohydrolase [Yersinia phage fPS-2]EFW4204062.1 dCTP pyrophosphatase [Shigella flexneri]VEV89645.1 dCTP pyrophosphatase, phage-associated [Yersinia phage fPS-2]